jgi:hypothetical protein
MHRKPKNEIDIRRPYHGLEPHLNLPAAEKCTCSRAFGAVCRLGATPAKLLRVEGHKFPLFRSASSRR